MRSAAIYDNHQVIIGRKRDRELLHHYLMLAVAGQGRFVLLSGEAGIGKTTLVRDLARKAKEAGALVLSGGCYDLTTTPPYGPWTEVFDAYRPDEILPAVPSLFRETTSVGPDVGSQTALFEDTQLFFKTVANHKPLALILEDLHWSDPASLELLRYLGRRCADDAIFFVATYRDAELTRREPLFQLLPLIVRETDAVRIEIQPLTTDEIRALLNYDGLSEADTDRLVRYLEKRSNGNPLFATELLRALAIERTLEVNDEGAWLGELDEDYLPPLVLQVIERRLDLLSSDARRAIEIAAVIGQDVPLQIWESVCGLTEKALDDAIEQALATHVLEETSERYGLSFTHALVREALYLGILPTRRRRWHRLVAEALIESPHPDPDTVAFHLERARDPRLTGWLILAGERAERQHAQLMAADHFDHAQELLEGDQERASERAWLLFRTGLLYRFSDFDKSLQRLEDAEAVATAAGLAGITHIARAHQGLVRCFGNTFLRGINDLQAGITALEELNDADRDVFDQLTASLDSRLGVQGRGTLALQMAMSGSFDDATAQLDTCREREWKTSPDASRAAGFIYAALGQPALARQSFTQSQSMYETLGDPGQAGVDAFWQLLTVQIPYAADQVQDRQQLVRTAQSLWARNTGVSLAERLAEALWASECLLSGDWAEADRLLRRQQRDSDFAFTFFGHWELRLALNRGNSASIWNAIYKYLPEGPATAPGDILYTVQSELQSLAVILALEAGQVDQAFSWLKANDRFLAWSGAVSGKAENQLLWARYYQLNGDLTLAHQLAGRSLVHASDPRQPLALIAAHRALGNLDTQTGQYAEAIEHLLSALTLADNCAAPFERALTLLEMARLRAAENQVDEAWQLLNEVQSICEPIEARPTLDQVAVLKSQLTQQRAVDQVPFGLTPRELEVLRLVTEGLTDAKVAERLFVSPRTVSSHLTSIYNKLGVSSRAAATRIAIERGIF